MRPGREIRPSSLTVDIHSHVAVPSASAIVQPYLGAETSPLIPFSSKETITVNIQQDRDRHTRMTGFDNGLKERLDDLDEMGIDVQIIMPPPAQCFYTVPTKISVQATRVLNEGIAEYVTREPKRFVGLGSVPMNDAIEAATELERATVKLGLKGALILTNVGGRELSDPKFEAFWAKASELDALIVIHPNGFTEGQRLSRFYFNNVIGNPLDTTIALHYLIFDGVLERYPRLKLLAVHGGGYVGAYSGRMDHAWGARSDCHANLPNPPSAYLKRVHVDSIVFTPHQLIGLVELFGANHVLMGTDYPFDMAESDPLDHIASVTAFSKQTVEAVAGGNAKRLLNL